MRYLIISDCFYPENKSISRHIYDLLKEINNQNDHAVLIFPKNKNKKNNKKNLYIKNIKYLPVELSEIKRESFIQRGLKELILPFKVLNLLKKQKIKVDKIIVFSPSIFFGLIFNKLKYSTEASELFTNKKQVRKRFGISNNFLVEENGNIRFFYTYSISLE